MLKANGGHLKGRNKLPPRLADYGAAGFPVPTNGVLGPGGIAAIGPDGVFGSNMPLCGFLVSPFSGPVNGQLIKAREL
jgi:hypothetical protein